MRLPPTPPVSKRRLASHAPFAALLAALVTLVWSAIAAATPGNEVVLILDGSGSMAAPVHASNGRLLPANDPERTAVLGALILEGLTYGTEDRVTVLSFGATETAPPVVVDPSSFPNVSAAMEAVRSMPYSSGTYFRPVLRRARDILDKSDREGRLLMFLTDGAPSDIESPSEGPALLNLGQAPFGTMILGLYGSEDSKQNGEEFLRPLARLPEDLVFLNSPREVVPAFTRGYARMLGARPLTGTLGPQSKKPINVGKYVLEVLVVTASSNPGLAFQAALSGPKGPVPVRAQGNNGCDFRVPSAPGICADPRRHFQVFRQTNDADNPSHWELSVAQSPGEIEYGIILRYDLAARLVLKPVVMAQGPTQLEAQLLFRGKTFVDEEFFRSDGFEAVASVGGTKVPLSHAGGGRFVGTWVPPVAMIGSGAMVRATFRNTWMERSTEASLRVEGLPNLMLRVNPNPLDLGAWDAQRSQTRHCGTLDLAGSANADRVELACTPGSIPKGVGVTCAAVAGSEAALAEGGKGQPQRWEVCVTASRCCGDESSKPPNGLHVVLAGKDPRHASSAVRVPVVFQVRGMSLLACWWPLLAAVAFGLFVLWVVMGFVRPHGFEPSVSVRVAGSEPGLRRTSALVLRELPGGVRGFYRSASISLNATGDFVKSARQAVLVVEAGPVGTTVLKKAAGLERKNRRTGGWEAVPPEEFKHGITPGVIYRLGSLVLKFE